MSKDRAAPFSKKHRKYWIPILGGMILIGVINVVIGVLSYEPPSDQHEKIKFDIPVRDAGVDATVDAASRPN